MTPERELGSFLRSRRDRRQPPAATAGAANRRVPGLRREEVAASAGVTRDYLRRLEQGRVLPSDAVLDAVSRALRLHPAERSHLGVLADRARGRQPESATDEALRPGLLRTLGAVSPNPAVVLGRRCEVLAWNAMGAALDPALADLPPQQRNVARRIVLDPSAHDVYPEWEALVQEVSDVLRLNAARFPADAALAALVQDLLTESTVFERCWQRLDVFEKVAGRKILNHPRVGRLDLTYEAFDVSLTSGATMLVYTAEDGSATASALAQLADTVFLEGTTTRTPSPFPRT